VRIGRFAPTPSGPLHLGSLLSAVGSWLDANRDGVCLLRIDDLDAARCKAEHDVSIRQALAAFGLDYPQPIMRQRSRGAAYELALAHLAERIPLFHCDCTRRELAAGTDPCCRRDCRLTQRDPTNSALRADLRDLAAMQVQDRSLGQIAFEPENQRDVIVRRRDGIIAYHLACVVDDAAQGITDVVRGADLFPSTPWQLALHQALALRPPEYLHLPLVTEANGQKLAKSRHSAPLDAEAAPAVLRQVLRWLKQKDPPADISSVAGLLSVARSQWEPQRFFGLQSVTLDR